MSEAVVRSRHRITDAAEHGVEIIRHNAGTAIRWHENKQRHEAIFGPDAQIEFRAGVIDVEDVQKEPSNAG